MSIKHLSPKTTGVQNFWKDHHAQHPGVDPGVYISGLEGKEKPVAQEGAVEDRTSMQEGPPTKRARTNTPTTRYEDEDIKIDDPKRSSQKDDTYRPSGIHQSSGQLGSNAPTTQPIFDT
jgi:hypothetical protein